MTESLSFARATRADVPRIEALVRGAFEPYVARIGRQPAPMEADYALAVQQQRVMLALDGDALLGVLVTEVCDAYLHVENLAVAPAARGRGIGTRLLDLAEAEARACKLTELRLYTNAKMTENLAYYPNRGYQEVDRRTEDGFDRVYFVRSLA